MRKKLLKLLREIERKQTFKESASSIAQQYDSDDSSWEEYVEYQRRSDQEHLLKYDYDRILEDEELHTVRMFLFFPNYGFIIDRFKGEFEQNIKSPPLFSERTIKAELARMEADRLISISTQEVSEYCLKTGSDYSTILVGDGWESKTESVILTTKGKNYWIYLWEKARENPIPMGISIVSLMVSILVAIFK